MNPDRLIQMLIRMGMRMFMRKGMQEVAKRTGSNTPETKRARQAMKMANRARRM